MIAHRAGTLGLGQFVSINSLHSVTIRTINSGCSSKGNASQTTPPLALSTDVALSSSSSGALSRTATRPGLCTNSRITPTATTAAMRPRPSAPSPAPAPATTPTRTPPPQPDGLVVAVDKPKEAHKKKRQKHADDGTDCGVLGLQRVALPCGRPRQPLSRF